MTAVEQFWKDVQDILLSSVDTETGIKLVRAYDKAKEMEKEQRERDFKAGNDSACMEHEDIKDYFDKYIKSAKEAYEFGQKTMYCGCYAIEDALTYEEWVSKESKSE